MSRSVTCERCKVAFRPLMQPPDSPDGFCLSAAEWLAVHECVPGRTTGMSQEPVSNEGFTVAGQVTCPQCRQHVWKGAGATLPELSQYALEHRCTPFLNSVQWADVAGALQREYRENGLGILPAVAAVNLAKAVAAKAWPLLKAAEPGN